MTNVDSSLTLLSYVFLSYVLKHDDGRVSYPLCFIYVSPQGLYVFQAVCGTSLQRCFVACDVLRDM